LTFNQWSSCFNFNFGTITSKITTKDVKSIIQCNHFDFELKILYFCMMCVVIKNLVAFLEFCKKFYNEGTQHTCNYIGFMVQRLVMFAKINSNNNLGKDS
jgi:uncharacterized membrane protein